MAGKSSYSKTFVWIILGLLILGLAGFGATNLSGTIRTIGTAGDQLISVDDYARELQREIRATEAQIGQSMTMEQARAAGIDQMVLARLVSLASLDNEVAQLGLSIGDENLQKEILEIPAFSGIDGSFDRESYRFALSQAGLNESEFEDDLRAESARTLVQGAIIAGVTMPDPMADAILGFVAARRNFVWAGLDTSSLAEPLAEPTDDDLRAFYDAHADEFRLPETKRISYVLLTPDMLVDQVELDEDAARALYDERADEYILPERRLVERLNFADDAAASDAMAQLEVGGTTFEQLVDARGLALGDIDMGDVTANDLGDAAEAVFAAEIGDVVGPLPTSLGPALFRVNGILAARSTSFEDALDELRDELASDRARRLVDAQAQSIDDLLAGGATLQEIANETDMELGQIDWSIGNFDGVAAYDAFRNAAASVTDTDFPAIDFLEDGGIFAIQLDNVLPPRPEPFRDARNGVIDGWTLEQTETALRAQAESAVAQMASGADFNEAGLQPRIENGLTRSAYIEGTPPDFMTQVFDMDVGEVRVISGSGTVQIVRLDALGAPEESAELQQLRDAITRESSQALSQALFEAYVRDVQLRAKPQIDQRALNAVQASFYQ